ncbi:MAG TPA: hypothetical protein VLI72_01855 [Methylibium sp.]|nr:hypothetical protein [Methylibium sp.]
MNIAYLDPPYSGYFDALATRLAGTSGGGAVTALLSCPSYRLYARAAQRAVWPSGDAETDHELPPEFARAGWPRSRTPAFRRSFSHAVNWFKQQFRERRIDVCLVFSDARPFSQAARVAAREAGVVCVYFERGAFRNRTASLSTQGLNARFDLAWAARDAAVKGLAPHALPPRREQEPWLRLRFALFMLLNTWACARQPELRPMQHKVYHPFNYARIAWRQWRAQRDERRARGRPPVPDDGRPLVLLPLQLQTDSQFVMHSPFAHNQAFIDFAVPRILAAAPGARVLVKRHPMDVRHFTLPTGAEFFDGTLGPLYGRAALLVCLNSTTGFEAAVLGKPVLCFADSFYTASPCIRRVDREGFERTVAGALLEGDDPARGETLKAAVLRWYQAPGDAWAYTDDDLDATTAIVLQHVRAARVQAVEPPAAGADPVSAASDRVRA